MSQSPVLPATRSIWRVLKHIQFAPKASKKKCYMYRQCEAAKFLFNSCSDVLIVRESRKGGGGEEQG